MSPLTKNLLCLIATLPPAHAAPLILGDTSGNTRGENAVDIQSFRTVATEVSSGGFAIAVGKQNTSSGNTAITYGVGNNVSGDSSSGIGIFNFVTGNESFSAGNHNNVSGDYAFVLGTENSANGDYALALGHFNITAAESISVGFFNFAEGLGYAFGQGNIVNGGSPGPTYYEPSGAFGSSNTISAGANDSFAYGAENTITATGATVFGTNITNSTAGSTMIGPSDAAKVTILSSGNVGIGTAAPTSKLHVVGDLNVTGSLINPTLNSTGSGPTSRLQVGGTVNPSSSWQGTSIVGADGQNKIITGYLASSTNGAVIGAHNSALNAWADLNVAGTNLIFRTNETERMRINSSGNVGLGTNSPAAKLHISSTGTDRGLRIQSTGSTSNDYAEAQFAANAREYRVGTGGSGSTVGLANKFYIWDSTAGAARAVIDSSGNLGVGTTSPQTKLHVTGDVRVEGAISTAAISRIHPLVIRGSDFTHPGTRLVKIGNSTATATYTRGLSLTIIEKATHAILSTNHYDTYASAAASDSLAVALNAMDKNQIGILASADNWEPAITTNLRSAFKRVGLSKAQAVQGDRKPYAAIFEGASNGKTGGNAIEVMIPGNDADQPFAEIRGWLIDGGFAVTPSSVVNALHSPNGATQAMLVSNSGDIAVKTTLRVPERGDIGMGGFTSGTNPAN